MGKGKGKETTVHHTGKGKGKETAIVKVVLSHMQDYDKIKVNVDDEFGADKAFREIIGCLRAKASEKKAVFHDIPCIGIVDAHGFPLMELQAIFEDRCGKVLISKKDLYVVAFHYRGSWFQLKSIDYDIYVDEKEECETFNYVGNYIGAPWEKIGPNSVITAINTFNHPRAVEIDLKYACQVFFVHFCESSRLRLIEEIVCRSFGPLSFLEFDEVEGDDIYNALKAKKHINPTYVYDSSIEDDSINSFFSGDLNKYLNDLIHGWGHLSEWWIGYSLRQGTSREGIEGGTSAEGIEGGTSGEGIEGLTSGEGIEGLTELDSKYKMKYVKSVKASLGILCRPNRDKLISGLTGKITQKELIKIEEKLKVLGDLNKI